MLAKLHLSILPGRTGNRTANELPPRARRKFETKWRPHILGVFVLR